MLHSEQFCTLTGMQYASNEKTYWGTLENYPVFLTYIPRRDTVIFRLIGKSGSVSEAEIQKQIETWSASHAGVSGMTYKERSLVACLSLTPRQTVETLAQTVAALTAFAADQSLIPCCMSCGTESGFRQYLLDHCGVTVCEACKPHLEQNMQDAEQKMAEKKPSITGTALGMIIGAAALFLLTFFVLKAQYLSLLTGYAGVLLSLYLMKKLGKKLTVSGTAVCTVLCLCAGISACYLHFAGEMASCNQESHEAAVQYCEKYEQMQEQLQESFTGKTIDEIIAMTQSDENPLDLNELRQNYEQAKKIRDYTTFRDCIRHFSELLHTSVYEDLQGEITKSILCTVLSVLIGIGITAPQMIRSDLGKHTLRELTA